MEEGVLETLADKLYPPNKEQKRFKLLACEIFYRECCLAVALSPNIIDVQFLTQGLHDLRSEKMAGRLQAEIDRVDPERYDGILLAYALCNNGVVGVSGGSLPLVIPRAHDCIALFLGSRQRYDEVFQAKPGTYFKTSGWIERDHENLEKCNEQDMSPMGALRSFEEMVEKYGEENAQYLLETLGGLNHYTTMAYIEMPDWEQPALEEQTRLSAEKMGLGFEKLQGNLRWLRQLTDGPWDADAFLLVPPGRKIAASHGEGVLKVE